jgi:hypothetical protein
MTMEKESKKCVHKHCANQTQQTNASADHTHHCHHHHHNITVTVIATTSCPTKIILSFPLRISYTVILILLQHFMKEKI